MIDASMARPTVLHLLAQFDFGGTEKHMAYIWSQADHHRYRHRFAAIGHGGFVEREMIADGAEVTCLGENPAIPRLGATRAVARLLRRIRPDVIHGHGPEPSFHGLLAGLFARVPIRVGEEFGGPTYSDRAAFVFRQIYRSAHSVFCNCEAVREAVIDRRIAPREKTFAMLNPIVVPKEPVPLEQDPEYFTLAYLGRLEPIKNPAILLPVLGQLRAEGLPARLWLIGDGSDRAKLETKAAELGLTDHITFWGFRNDVEEILCKADVFVLPSLTEGSPLALGEAMGSRLPAVSSNVGGCGEMIEARHSGFLLPPQQVQPLVDAVRELWSMGPDGRRELGERAREAVIDLCDTRRYVARLEDFYDSLRSGKGQ
jgi:glycosyltransferase involved in cell wall biosynthesis